MEPGRAAAPFFLAGGAQQIDGFAIDMASLRTFLDLRGITYASAEQHPEPPVAALAQAVGNFVSP